MTTLPGLLLMHGVGDDGRCWEPFVERLRNRPDLADLRVETPSAPGHGGRLAGPGASVAWPDLLASAVASAESLAESTGLPILVGGHSMGALMALGVAATRPDLACGLWLEDPPFTQPMADDPEDPEPVPMTEVHDWFEYLRSIPLETVIAQARQAHPGWNEGEYERWAAAKQAVDPTAFAEPVIWVLSGWARLARDVRCPVVVAAGEPQLGAMVAREVEDDLTALSGWSLHRLPTGHDVRREAPDATVDLLAGFIRAIAG